MDEADQTANVKPTMVDDQNGEKCALIKIATTQKNFTFDVGTLGITKTEWQNSNHPGEIWLYVPNGVMKMSIQHPQFGTIKDYDLGSRLKKGRTYVMELTSDQVNTLVVDYDNNKILNIALEPKEATLYINGLKQRRDSTGIYPLELPFGTHIIRAIAKNYHPLESQVTINDNDKTQTLSLKLKQAFGYLTINASRATLGADVYINDILIGQLPIDKHHVKSGTNDLKIIKKLYKPYSTSFNVTDSAYVLLSPSLEPNYANVSISVADYNTQIFINDTLVANNGLWNGQLEEGEYSLKLQKENYHSQTRHLIVKSGSAINLKLEKLNLINNPQIKRASSVSTNKTTKRKNLVSESNFYLQAGYEPLLNTFGFGLGANEHRINTEGNFRISLEQNFTLRASLKIGTDFRIKNRVRITPQIGAQLSFLGDYSNVKFDNSSNPDNIGASFIIATRLDVAMSSFFGLSFTPKYLLALNESIEPIRKSTKGFGFQINAVFNFPLN
ncbi:MAG: PEGA domain-containing protein [Muribaculaceae bacterium]|nr:PEGA domain-containing protein [Muribaculaceae bacterium]